jgi:hypothetical protein
MKFQFSQSPYGFEGDPRGAHVVMDYDDRQLLGTVVDFFYTDVAGWLLEVRHFNGEPWPLIPLCGGCASPREIRESKQGNKIWDSASKTTMKLIDRYMIRCPYCKSTFAVEGSSPWTRKPVEILSIVESHVATCPKTEIRLQFLGGNRAEAAYNILTCTWKISQVRGTFKAEVKCDGRCTHAKGSNCECSCGGKNHGSGR